MLDVAALAVVRPQRPLVAAQDGELEPLPGLHLAHPEQVGVGEQEVRGLLPFRVLVEVDGADREARDAVRHALVDDHVDRDLAAVRAVLQVIELDDRVEVALVAVDAAHRQDVGVERVLEELLPLPVEEPRPVELDARELLQAAFPEPHARVGVGLVAVEDDVLDAHLRALADLEDHVGRSGRLAGRLLAAARDDVDLRERVALAVIALEEPLADAGGLVEEELAALAELRPLPQRLDVDLHVPDEARFEVDRHLDDVQEELDAAFDLADARLPADAEDVPERVQARVDRRQVEARADLLPQGLDQLLLAVALASLDPDPRHDREVLGLRRRLLRRPLRRRRILRAARGPRERRQDEDRRAPVG
jgi:hypothetical protein